MLFRDLRKTAIRHGNISRLFRLYLVKGAINEKVSSWHINPPTDGPKSILLLRHWMRCCCLIESQASRNGLHPAGRSIC